MFTGGSSRPRGTLAARKIHGRPWHVRLRQRLAALWAALGLLALVLAPGAVGLQGADPGRRVGWGWRLRNLPHWWRGAWRLWLAQGSARVAHLPIIHSALRLELVRANGERVDYGVVSYRVVTTAFVNALAAYMVSNGASPAPDAFDYHASGTGTNAEASGDTALQTDSGVSRATGTPSNPSANVYRTVATQTYSSSLAITEHGVFSASTSGTLLDRSVFSAVNVVNGDSIQFTYSLTISAGG